MNEFVLNRQLFQRLLLH